MTTHFFLLKLKLLWIFLQKNDWLPYLILLLWLLSSVWLPAPVLDWILHFLVDLCSSLWTLPQDLQHEIHENTETQGSMNKSRLSHSSGTRSGNHIINKPGICTEFSNFEYVDLSGVSTRSHLKISTLTRTILRFFSVPSKRQSRIWLLCLVWSHVSSLVTLTYRSIWIRFSSTSSPLESFRKMARIFRTGVVIPFSDRLPHTAPLSWPSSDSPLRPISSLLL